MEVDSLKSVNYGMTNGTDYTVKNIPNAAKGSSRKNKTVADPNEASVDNKQTRTVSESVESKQGKEIVDSLRKDMEDFQESVSMEFLNKFIKEANKKIFATNRQFDFSIHEETNRVIIKVVDSSTKEVIKEIPPEKTLDAAAKMLELAGVIVDEKI